MRRCFDLARLGAQTVSPNPLVGAVIVHNDFIIGEGYHHTRGAAHAEVNAFAAVSKENKYKIPDSTIYISLEPCSHQGLTPPCSDLILENGIKRVVISAIDPNQEVTGRGIAKLQARGVSVTSGVLEEEGNQLIANFRSVMEAHRPYIILKFVQSRDRYIGHPDYQVWLSNGFEKILVHKLRSEVDGIMVGTNTVIVDNPQLSSREYFGNNPVRISFDRNRRIPKDFHILDGSIPTLIYTEASGMKAEQPGLNGIDENSTRHRDQSEIQSDTPGMDSSRDQSLAQKSSTSSTQSQRDRLPEYIPINFGEETLHNCLDDLGRRNIQSVLVEGGASLINSFLKHNLWDEAWVVTTHHELGQGVKAPLLQGHLMQKFCLDTDEIQIIKRI